MFTISLTTFAIVAIVTVIFVAGLCLWLGGGNFDAKHSGATAMNNTNYSKVHGKAVMGTSATKVWRNGRLQ